MKFLIPFVLLMGMITGCAFQYQVDDHESRLLALESQDEILDNRIEDLYVKMFQGLMLAAQEIDELEMFNEEMTIKEAIKVLNENDQASKELFEKIKNVLVLMSEWQDLHAEEDSH